MKNPPDDQGILFVLLKNSIVQFVAGVLSLFIILILASKIDFIIVQVMLKALGYGFFCYLTTPFMIYWLAYASAGRVTTKKIMMTIALTTLYSFIIWDAYFFFRGAIATLFFSAN
ncbi:MAG: hypothetical protein HC930_10910 [Hydrococcus sp. SU_1_0]|nr:hypothetical protein [Hydrococcus sp. SU_1_0]